MEDLNKKLGKEVEIDWEKRHSEQEAIFEFISETLTK